MGDQTTRRNSWVAILVRQIVTNQLTHVPGEEQFNSLLSWLSSRDNPIASQISAEFLLHDYSEEKARTKTLTALDRLLFSSENNPPDVILGLPGVSDKEIIKNRYRRLMQVYHPDKASLYGQWVNHRAEIINRAYTDASKIKSAKTSVVSKPVPPIVPKTQGNYGLGRDKVNYRKKLGSAQRLRRNVFIILGLFAFTSIGLTYLSLQNEESLTSEATPAVKQIVAKTEESDTNQTSFEFNQQSVSVGIEETSGTTVVEPKETIVSELFVDSFPEDLHQPSETKNTSSQIINKNVDVANNQKLELDDVTKTPEISKEKVNVGIGNGIGIKDKTTIPAPSLKVSKIDENIEEPTAEPNKITQLSSANKDDQKDILQTAKSTLNKISAVESSSSETEPKQNKSNVYKNLTTEKKRKLAKSALVRFVDGILEGNIVKVMGAIGGRVLVVDEMKERNEIYVEHQTLFKNSTHRKYDFVIKTWRVVDLDTIAIGGRANIRYRFRNSPPRSFRGKLTYQFDIIGDEAKLVAISKQ